MIAAAPSVIEEIRMRNTIPVLAMPASSFSAMGTDMSNGADNFYTSDKVSMQKVSFPTQYGLKVAGNLFVPKDLDRRRPAAAIVVGHPMGAVKEQSANLYAGGATKYTGGTVHQLDENTHPIQREFFDFYRTPRGQFTPASSSAELTTHPTLSSNTKFMNYAIRYPECPARFNLPSGCGRTG